MIPTQRGPKARRLALTLVGVLALLTAEPAYAAGFDIDHLPEIGARTLTSSITTWSIAGSVITWSIAGSVTDLAQTTREAGQTVVTLDADVLFDFGKAILPPAASARIAAAVAKAPRNGAVSIGGHTDGVGTTAANNTLSQARAQAVAVAFKAARPDLVLTIKGFGESKPVASNRDAQGRSKNRRVEIRFVG